MRFISGLKKENTSIVEKEEPTESYVEPQPQEAIDLLPVKSGNRWGFIDMTGQIVIRPQFDSAHTFSEGLARIRLDGKGGFIDKTGKIVIEPQFVDMFRFTEALAAVKPSDSWRFIDPAGAFVGGEKFDEVHPFHEGLARVKIGKKWGYANSQGNVAIRPDFDKAADFSEGLAGVYVLDQWSFIDKSGTVIMTTKFNDDFASPRFSEGLALGRMTAGSGSHLAFMNRKGEIVSSLWSLASDFSEGLASVSARSVDPLYAYITKNGKFAIPHQFRYAEAFSEGLAAVQTIQSNGKWGFIDKTGKLIIESKFDYVLDMDLRFVLGFVSGLALVGIGGRHAYIDMTGRCISFQTLD